MIRKHIIFFLSIITVAIFIASCFNKSKKEYKETYYSSGKIESAGWYLDTLWVDTMYDYFQNGQISSIQVRNDSGILNGTARLFYEDSKPYQVVNYINGEAEGFAYEYTKDGKLKSRVYYVDDKQVGDCYWYFSDGSIREYGFFDFLGDNRNLMKWDSISNIITKDLRPIVYVYSIRTYIDSLVNPSQSLYNVSLVASNPPKCRTVIYIEYLQNDVIMQKDSIVNEQYYFRKRKFSDSITNIIYSGVEYDSTKKKFLYQNDSVVVKN